MILGGNFDWVENADGTVTVLDVPIFATCQRGEFTCDEPWMEAAFRNASEAAADGHLPPMHVYHHGAASEPVSAGAFRIKSVKRRKFKGRIVPMHVADLIFTSRAVFEEVRGKRLLYRSVEINPTKQKILSLALLDHEAPFFDLPMTTLADSPLDNPDNLAPVTNGEGAERREPLVAFRHQESTRVLMEFPMADEITTTNGTPDAMTTTIGGWRVSPSMTVPGSTNFAEDSEDKPEPAGDDDEKMAEGEGATIDADACVKAIESGSITLADFEAIKAAMVAREGAAVEEAPAEVEAPEESEGPPDLMQAGDAEKFSELLVEMRAEKATNIKFREEYALERALDGFDAKVIAESRISGGDFRAELVSFAAAHGREAMEAHAAKSIAAMPVAGDDTFAPGAVSSAPAEVQKYANDPAKYEQAQRFAAKYDPSATSVPLDKALDNLFGAAHLFAASPYREN